MRPDTQQDKPKTRRNKIIFIYGAKEYLEGKNRNKIREQTLQRFQSTFEPSKTRTDTVTWQTMRN